MSVLPCQLSYLIPEVLTLPLQFLDLILQFDNPLVFLEDKLFLNLSALSNFNKGFLNALIDGHNSLNILLFLTAGKKYSHDNFEKPG